MGHVRELNLMEIMASTSKLRHSLLFLHDLCRSLSRQAGDGVFILQYLYQTIRESIDNEKALSIFLFRSCFEPLIEIVSEWIYCAQFRDFYNEFATKADDERLRVKFDKLPLFLSELCGDIERTGFCLNILKHCDLNLFHVCFVPNFFFDNDDEHSIDYPIRAVFNCEEIQMFAKRQKKLIRLQLSFFDEAKDAFYQKQKANEALICQQNKQKNKSLKQKLFENEEEMRQQRMQIMEKQQKMKRAMQQTLRRRSKMKQEAKQKKIENEKQYLLQIVIDEDIKIQKEKAKIKEKLKKVEAERAKLSKKGTKMNSELEEYKDAPTTNANYGKTAEN